MDIISHAIVGRMLVSKKRDSYTDLILIPFFGSLPDIFQIPLYIYIGYINSRPFFYPLTSDWNGFRDASPLWVLWWDIPHSLFFLLLVIVPIVWLLKLNKWALVAYFSHLFLDWFTHTGEWGVKPLFPLQFMFNGFTDMWAWNPLYYPIIWLILWGGVIAIEEFRAQKEKK